MKLLFKVKEEKKKELMFRGNVDPDGDFLVQASSDGEEWWSICYICSIDGDLNRPCFIPKELGLQVNDKGQIELGL